MVTDFSTFSRRLQVGILPTLVYHILHDDLHVKPYKYQENHKLEESDYEKSVKFAQWFFLRPTYLLRRSLFFFHIAYK